MFPEGTGPLMVYRPHVKDTRKLLAKTDCPGVGEYCILADGRITGLEGRDTFKQFDGKSWRPLKNMDASKVGIHLETYALLPAQKAGRSSCWASGQAKSPAGIRAR